MTEERTILEGIVTTTAEDGSTNVSPMGPIVDEPIVDGPIDTLVLRPYRTSTTYQNLKRTGVGVFHVTDDVELIARAAVDRLEAEPNWIDCEAVDGRILADACRWYAFRVAELDDRQERTEIVARVVDRGRLRDFFGFNRAKHAVLEAAILATRLAFLPADEIFTELERLAVPVKKTAGRQEQRAFDFLVEYVHATLASKTD